MDETKSWRPRFEGGDLAVLTARVSVAQWRAVTMATETELVRTRSPFVLVQASWCAALRAVVLLLPNERKVDNNNDNNDHNAVVLPDWWTMVGAPSTGRACEASVTLQRVSVREEAAQELTLQPLHENAVVVSSERSEFTCHESTAAQVAATTLLGHVVADGTVVALPLRNRVCLFVARCDGVRLVAATTKIFFDLSPMALVPEVVPELFGCEPQATDLRKLLEQSVAGSRDRVALGLSPLRAIVVSGPSGCGKTTLVRNTCKHMQYRLIVLSVFDALGERGKRVDHGEAPLREVEVPLARASLTAASSILLVRDVQLLSAAAGANFDDDHSTHQADVISAICSLVCRLPAQCIMVIESAIPAAALPATLRAVAPIEVRLDVPSREVREALLTRELSHCDVVTAPGSNAKQAFNMLAQRSAGFSGTDIVQMCRAAMLAGATRAAGGHDAAADVSDQMERLQLSKSKLRLTIDDDLKPVFASWKPSSQADEWADQMVVAPSAVFQGYDTVRQALQRAILMPLLNPEAFDRLGITRPRGVLLFGPPGCGKTLIVQSMLATMPASFIQVRGSSLYSKYLGESERAVRRVFAYARKRAPCVIFFDELDALAAKRDITGGDGSSGVNERVLSQLLNEMDGIGEVGHVVVLGCTNRPDMLDDALLRPGRLDQLVHIDRPRPSDRRAMLAALKEQVPSDDSVDVPELVAATEAFVGADLVAMYRDAAMLALRQCSDLLALEQQVRVSMAHLQQVLPVWRRSSMRPSLTEYVRINFDFASQKGLAHTSMTL